MEKLINITKPNLVIHRNIYFSITFLQLFRTSFVVLMHCMYLMLIILIFTIPYSWLNSYHYSNISLQELFKTIKTHFLARKPNTQVVKRGSLLIYCKRCLAVISW